MHLNHLVHKTWCKLTWNSLHKKIKLRYIKFTQGKGGANKCKLRGITQVD